MSRYFARLAQRSDVIARTPRAHSGTAPTIAEHYHEVTLSAPQVTGVAPADATIAAGVMQPDRAAPTIADANVAPTIALTPPTARGDLPLAPVRHDEVVTPLSTGKLPELQLPTSVSTATSLPQSVTVVAANAMPSGATPQPARRFESPTLARVLDHGATDRLPPSSSTARALVPPDTASPVTQEIATTIDTPTPTKPAPTAARAIPPTTAPAPRVPVAATRMATQAVTHAVQVQIGKIELEVHAAPPVAAPKSAPPAVSPAPATPAPRAPRFNMHRHYLRGGG